MRSAKSFFNGAIARSDLRRYWPVLFLYVGLWLLFLPIPVWNRAAERNPALVNLTELCADTYATAVVLAHNHPSGIALPSDDDCAATTQAVQALQTIGVVLADHIIVADDDFVSMAQSGYLS